MPSPRTSAPLMAAIFVTSGVIHLVRPKVFTPLIPKQLGDPEPWVLWSGVAELALAAGLVAPRTRRPAALAAAALLVGVFPGNVQMAVDGVRSPRSKPAYKAAVLLRLPLQAPLVRWALAIADGARVSGTTGR